MTSFLVNIYTGKFNTSYKPGVKDTNIDIITNKLALGIPIILKYLTQKTN